jgi:hypothetical protein
MYIQYRCWTEIFNLHVTFRISIVYTYDIGSWSEIFNLCVTFLISILYTYDIGRSSTFVLIQLLRNCNCSTSDPNSLAEHVVFRAIFVILDRSIFVIEVPINLSRSKPIDLQKNYNKSSSSGINQSIIIVRNQ